VKDPRLPLLATAIVLSVGGCTWILGSGRDLGTGLADGIRRAAMRDSARWAIDSLAMRSGRSVGRALGAEIAPVVDSSVAGLLLRTRGSLLETSDSLAGRLRGPVADAGARAVRRAIAGGTAQLRADADPTVEAWSSAVDRELRPRLVRTVSEATDSASSRLAYHLRTDLSESFESLMVRSVRAADRESSKSKITIELRRTLAIAGGLVLLGLVLFAAWLWRDRRKGRRSLAAVARVINRPDNEYLKPRIREEAKSQGVEGWLNDFLQNNGL
jgi:hypothetical protein